MSVTRLVGLCRVTQLEHDITTYNAKTTNEDYYFSLIKIVIATMCFS